VVKAPVVVKAPAPVNLRANPAHAQAYALWEDTYLTSKASDANALAESPVFNWAHAAGSKEATWITANGKDTTAALKLQSKSGLFNVAKRQQRRAVEAGADVQTLKTLGHMANEAKYKYLTHAFAEGNIGGGGTIDTNYLKFFAERESYLMSADKYNAVAKSDASAAKKAAAAEDLKYATWDLMFKIPSSTGLFDSDSSFKTIVGLMSSGRDLKSAQQDYDSSIATYESDPSVGNFYSAEIAEKGLELAEAEYTIELSGNIDSLSSLMSGNYANALNFKVEMITAEIAALEEQVAAEKYMAEYGAYPYGRREERPSLAVQQRLYYNLLN